MPAPSSIAAPPAVTERREVPTLDPALASLYEPARPGEDFLVQRRRHERSEVNVLPLDELQALFEIKLEPLHTLPLQLMMLSLFLKFSKCPTLMLHSYLLAGLWTRTETCSSLTRLLTFGKFVQVVFFDTMWFHVASPST